MTKMIYVAYCDKGDSFDLIHTYDLDEARKAIEMDKYHTTKREAEKCRWHIDGWNIEAQEGQDAKEAYAAWDEENCWIPDPDFYEEA